MRPISPTSRNQMADNTRQPLPNRARRLGQRAEDMGNQASMTELDAYTEYMQRKNLTSKSITQWAMVARRWSEWFDGDHWQATGDDVEAWLWDAQPHLKATSRRNYLKGLRSFYVWGQRTGRCGHDPTADVVKPREPVLRPDPVQTADVRRAIDSAGPVMAAVLSLAAYAGLRCAEISALRWRDIDDTGIRVQGKGRRERRVPLHPQIAGALEPLRHDPAPDGRIFGWSPEMVSQRGSAYLRALGVDVRKPMHGLRAWFATRLYEVSGHDLLLVRETLGHSSVHTTAMYAQVADDAAASAVASIAA